MPTTKLIAYILGGLALVLIPTYFIVTKPRSVIISPPVTVTPPVSLVVSEPICLADNEYVEYSAERETIATATISIKDKNTKQEIRSFTIPDVMGSNYHPYEIYNCHLYILKYFPVTDGRDRIPTDIWVYDYSGNGKELVREKGDFRVDETEAYIAYENLYWGEADYGFVIQNLKSGKIVFSIKLKDLVEKYNIQNPAPIILVDSNDNYMRFQLNNDEVTAVRVYTDDWHIEVF